MEQTDRDIAAATRPAPAMSGRSRIVAEFGELYRILRRRGRLVLGTAVLLGLAAAGYVLLVPPVYTATARILLGPSDRQVAEAGTGPGAIALDGAAAPAEGRKEDRGIAEQARAIGSDAVLGRAVVLSGLEREPGFGTARTDLVSRVAAALRGLQRDSRPEPPADPQARALDQLRRKLTVARSDAGAALDVTVATADAALSARIVDAVAGAYLAERNATHLRASERASADLRGRLDALRKAVDSADRKLADFTAANGRAAPERLPQGVAARASAARGRTAEAKARLDGIRTARGGPVTSAAMQAVRSPTLDRLRGRYAALAARDTELRKNLGDKHPFIGAVRDEMQEVRRLVDAELDRSLGPAEAEYRRAQTDERAATADLDRQREQAATSARTRAQESQARLGALRRDAEAARAAYDAALSRARAIEGRADAPGSPARIVAAAPPPPGPDRLPRTNLVLAALAGGLGLGAGLALLREYAAPRALSPDQLERVTGAPVIAAMPTIRPGTAEADAAAGRALDQLAALGEPHGRSLAVFVASTEADAAERRAAVALLAAAGAGRGDRVLVVNADLRGDGGGEGGFLDVLRGERSLNALARLDPATGARRIGPGDAGRPVGDALLLANAERFVAAVKNRFELILIDGGAPSNSPELAPVAAAADRLLLVARTGATRQRDPIDLAAVSDAAGLPVSGTLLVDRRDA